MIILCILFSRFSLNSEDNHKKSIYLTINEMTYPDHNTDLLVHKVDQSNVIEFA
jgi:hypothetical protein